MITSISPKQAQARPLIVGLGGTMRANSSSELALRMTLTAAEKAGARTMIFSGSDLDLPTYNPETPERSPKAMALISALRSADGVIISSPAYHGSLPGYLKNALDYVEDMRADERIYFEGRAVGCIVCAAGWQAVGPTLTTLRSIVHALRGWPTPLAVGVNSLETRFSPDGTCTSDKDAGAISIMAGQVVRFAHMSDVGLSAIGCAA
ncbi:MAG: NAD(P)H-dependent oxidoreductase [Mesorhizobium sp.]